MNREIWKEINGFPEIENIDKLEANHKNGIKNDNRSENLEWVAHSEHVIYACKNGLGYVGENINKIRKKLETYIKLYQSL